MFVAKWFTATFFKKSFHIRVCHSPTKIKLDTAAVCTGWTERLAAVEIAVTPWSCWHALVAMKRESYQTKWNRKLFGTRNFYYLVQWNLGMTKAKGKLFAITKFRYIEVLFHILYYYWGKENRWLYWGLRYIYRGLLYRGFTILSVMSLT